MAFQCQICYNLCLYSNIDLSETVVLSFCCGVGKIFNAGHLYGLEKFWAFLKYSKRNVVINWKIQGWLNKFQRMEDFRGMVGVFIVGLFQPS